jgi:S1-C subfamily serine protease
MGHVLLAIGNSFGLTGDSTVTARIVREINRILNLKHLN